VARAEVLTVWLRGESVGQLLRQRDGRLDLRYDSEAVTRLGESAMGVSVTLPVRTKPYRGQAAEVWAEGLLPEGETRTTLERLFRVRRGDTFGLLRMLGRDCAGAVAFTEVGEPYAQSHESAPLSQDEVEAAIGDLGTHPLGAGEEVRVSLGGLQSKLLLVRDGDGWARPLGGRPSTHILKPEPAAFPGLAAAEAFSQRAAAAAGIAAARVELARYGGRDVLVVERFDREPGPQGAIGRVHQEDGCQALGIAPDDKYQRAESEPPSYRALAAVLAEHADDPQAELARLAEMLAFTVALGNTDAHARNHSFLHLGGRITLAPLYDAAPTAEFVATRSVALWVAGQPLLSALTHRHLHEEAVSWGLTQERARIVVDAVLERLDAAFEAAATHTPQVDPALVERVRSRTARLCR
jgi:serine/threonine-protein kinase HipA